MKNNTKLNASFIIGKITTVNTITHLDIQFDTNEESKKKVEKSFNELIEWIERNFEIKRVGDLT